MSVTNNSKYLILTLLALPAVSQAQTIGEVFNQNCNAITDNIGEGSPLGAQAVCEGAGIVGDILIGGSSFGGSLNPITNTNSSQLNNQSSQGNDKTIERRLKKRRDEDSLSASNWQSASGLNFAFDQPVNFGGSAGDGLSSTFGLFGTVKYTDGKRKTKTFDATQIGTLNDAIASTAVNNRIGYDYEIMDILIGLDKSLTDNTLVGFALRSSSSDMTDISGGKADTKLTELITYAGWYNDSGLYVDVSAGISSGTQDNSRVLNYTFIERVFDNNLGDEGEQTIDLAANVKSKADTSSNFLMVAVGQSRNLGDWQVSYSASANWRKNTTDAYSENAVAQTVAYADVETMIYQSFLLNVNKQIQNSLQGHAVLEFSKASNYSWGVLSSIYGGRWVKEFKNQRDLTAAFLLAEDNYFKMEVPELDDNYIQLEATWVAVLPNDLNMFFSVDTFVGHDDLSQVSFSLGARKGF